MHKYTHADDRHLSNIRDLFLINSQYFGLSQFSFSNVYAQSITTSDYKNAEYFFINFDLVM